MSQYITDSHALFETPHDKTNKMICAQWIAKDPRYFHTDRKALIRLGGCPADLSFRWAHISFGWFCHDAAHLLQSQRSLRCPGLGESFQWGGGVALILGLSLTVL